MSKIPPENNASFLETMAKGILNRSQGTTFIAEEQKTYRENVWLEVRLS